MTCSHKYACSPNASFGHHSQRFIPQIQTVVENRSCFYCKKQGHLISVCPLLAKKQLGKGASRTSKSKNSSTKSHSMRGSASPPPAANINKIESVKSSDQNLKVVDKQPSKSQMVWKIKGSQSDSSSNNDASVNTPDLFKNKILTDVVILDDATGLPNSVKAWVSLTN